MTTLKTLLCLILLAILGFGIYANSLNSEFHFDDFIYIVENPGIRDVFDLKAIRESLPRPSRFVTFLTFAVNYHFHQLDVRGYHIVNVAIHIVNAWLVFWLALLLVRSPRLREDECLRPRMFAFALITASLFLGHPLQTEAVTYLCQRFTSLATFFYVLTLCCYLQGRLCRCSGYRLGFWFGGCVSAVLGMFTKEIVMTLPIVVVIAEMMFMSTDKWNIKALAKRPWFWLGAFFTLCFLAIVPAIFSFDVINMLTMETESWSYQGDYLTSGTYFLTQLRVVTHYIRMLFVPIGQNLLYDFPTSTSIFEMGTWAALFFLMGILMAGVKFRRKWPILAFGIFWFFLTLSIESTFITIKQVIFEHRCYLPSVGFSLALVSSLFYALKTSRKIYFTAVGIVLILSFLTIQRNVVWSTEESLWKDVQKKSPRQERPFTYVGMAFLNQGRAQDALIEFDNAIKVNPDKAESYNNRGNAYMALGRYQEALQDYDTALERDSSLEKTYTNRAVIFGQSQKFEESLKDFEKALQLNPTSSQAYYNRGNVYLKMDRAPEARRDYLRVIELNPADAKAYYKIGNIESVHRNFLLALEYLNKALALDSTNVKYLNNRSIVYFELGQYQKALTDVLKVQELGFKVSDDYLIKLNQALQKSQ